MQTILVTGAGGFIGSFLCKRVLETSSANVVGLDSLNDYYAPALKEARLRMLRDLDVQHRFTFVHGDITDAPLIEELFSQYKFDIVVNLAAQAGVRYSIDNPRAYVDSNLIGFFNILEACRSYPVGHLVFASSSSVYGGNFKTPFSEDDPVDHPVSLYAATKRSNELMAYAYSKLYTIPCTGLRFFTVYGPMGRPDMAYFKFADKITRGEPIQLYNRGDMRRDFTYIDDVVAATQAIMQKAPCDDGRGAKFEVYNVGNSRPENLVDFVRVLEDLLLDEGVIKNRPEHQLRPMQPGDVCQTYADTAKLERDFGFRPTTELAVGLRAFVQWYRSYYFDQVG